MNNGAISRTLQDRTSDLRIDEEAFGVKAPAIMPTIRRIQLVACGTSYHASLVAKYWIEKLAHLPVRLKLPANIATKTQIIEPDTLFITLSQSGETADTLAALRLAKKNHYAATLAICNVADSSIVRESELVLLMDAGPEIGVASTKAFTCQLTALLMIAIMLAQERKTLKNAEDLIQQLKSIPGHVEAALKLSSYIKDISHLFADKENAIFIARGIQYPIAMEGALKLKEISYIHAESYPAGELKHGPIALINPLMPTIALCPNDCLVEKLQSSIEEILARSGQIILFADENIEIMQHEGLQLIRVPSTGINITHHLCDSNAITAYHVAVLKGTNIDQPESGEISDGGMNFVIARLHKTPSLRAAFWRSNPAF